MRAYDKYEARKIVSESNWRSTYAKLGRHPTIQELTENYKQHKDALALSKAIEAVTP